MRSVLRDWVMELPLREQGTLLTCIRGCDLTPKLPLHSLHLQPETKERFIQRMSEDRIESDTVVS